MGWFEEMAGVIGEALHGEEIALARLVYVRDGRGGSVPAGAEELGVVAGNLQAYSAQLAQQEYGVACRATKRLFCAPDERVQPGVLANGWKVAAVPVRCRSHMVALLEEVTPGDRAGD